MEQKVKDFIRKEIIEGLRKLPEGWQRKFKLMYASGNMNYSIEEVVNNMPDEKIDFALTQVENSLKAVKYRGKTIETK